MAGGRPIRWTWMLLGICAVALVVRLVYVFGWQDIEYCAQPQANPPQCAPGELHPQSDAYYYHAAANLLADGEGFVHPILLEVNGVREPGADHPPGYSIVLAVPSLLGLDTIRSHQVVTCLMGTGTVALLGLLGRRLAGGGVGLVAAGFAAVYPNLWLMDASLMSESLALLAGVAVSFVAYQAWDQPSVKRFAVLGGVLGLASLVRAETALLLALLVVPLCVWVPKLQGWRERAQRAAVTGGVTLLVLAPWVVPNLFRFEHPATLSTQMGPTLEVANCDLVYYGRDRSGADNLAQARAPIGGWSTACASELVEHRPESADSTDSAADAGADAGAEPPAGCLATVPDPQALPPGVYRCRAGQIVEPLPGVSDPYDRSELDKVTRDAAVDYMSEHKGRVPAVMAARLGRTFGLYAPLQQLDADAFSESRPLESARVGLGLYYLAAVAAVVGVVALRRKGVPSFPLTVWIVNVSLTVLLFYGWTRFRAPAEPALVLPAAVGLNDVFRRLRGKLTSAPHA